jgi:predicted alpha/beta hydrolase family esterase
MDATKVLLLPGLGDSDPGHWQSQWERANPHWRRVAQRDWDRPVYDDWYAALETAVAASGPDTVLVAHSLGCLLVNRWAAQTDHKIRGAMLVAPPDPHRPSFPPQVSGFAELPLRRLPFATLVVASDDDPYATPGFARRCVEAWGGRLVELGNAGHINTASGYGAWPQGRALLDELLGAA